MSAALNVLQFCIKTRHWKLPLGGGGKLEIFTDSDYGGDKIDRKSTTGVLIRMGNGNLLWKSVKQQLVADSTTIAELYALCYGAKEAKFLKEILTELGEPDGVTPIFCDNDAVRAAIERKCHTKNLKHVEIRQRMVVSNLPEWNMKVQRVPSKEQLADILTKSVVGDCFHHLAGKIMYTVQSQGEVL